MGWPIETDDEGCRWNDDGLCRQRRHRTDRCAAATCPLRARDLRPLVKELADALEGLIAYEDEDCDPEFHYLGNDLRALVERAREEAG